ncbi:MAG: DNA mismatch repair endonuclease MutL [Halobacteriaceae archaeon]
MPTIERLSEDAVARIAAGEVVTRPASVVRELVENALDAGASRVAVAVEGDGTDLIRVEDDGRGMDAEDAALAVERHATSKVSDADEVARAETFGFRGEALPSVAEVATLDLTTKAEGVRGTRVVVDGGEKRVEAAGHGVGTTVEVRDLFAATPARERALASADREFARVSEAVSGYALANPDVRFRLDHDGRTVLSAPGSGDPTDAAHAVWGRDVAGQGTVLEATAGEVTVRGFLASPAVTRASASNVRVAVDGRPLTDSTLRNAVREGYGTHLPADRHPVAAVSVDLPPADVDQNVHPAKREVAFADPESVAAAVETAVADALSGADLARVADVEFGLADPPGESAFADVSVVGQFRDLYLLCEDGGDLLVVDQHAAHERVNYERLLDAVGDEVATERLDPPVSLSLSPAEASLVAAHREELAAAGFEVEAPGNGTCRVAAVPAPFGDAADPEDVRDVLDAVVEGGVEDPREEALKAMACHPSLKAGDDLSTAEAERLVAHLGACETPTACPHGRPTVVSIDEATLAREFDRPNTRLE